MMNDFVKISDLFDLNYGNSLELIHLEQCKSVDVGSVPFVSRTEKNNGVAAFVYELININPNPKHSLTVALGGSVLSTFYQPLPFYTGFHVSVLTPKKEMSVLEMLFYAKCISSNKYKYSYGRQANRTLKDLLIPKRIPKKLLNTLINYKNILDKTLSKNSVNNQIATLHIDEWKSFNINDLFSLEKCKCSNASKLLTKGNEINYIGAKKSNNGVMQRVEIERDLVSKGNCILFIGDGQGSIGYATYQPIDFIGSTTLTCGYNKFLNKYNALFLVTILDLERFRYSFGRKYGKAQLEKATIKLPSKNGNPDFDFMEAYIKTLKYSKSI